MCKLGNAYYIECKLSMTRKYISFRLFFVAVSIVVLIAGLFIWRAHCAMTAARQYVSDVSQLRVGTSGFEDLARIREKYAAYSETGQPCKVESCVAKFRFSNGLPIRIYQDRPAFLYSVLTLSNGLLTGVGIGAVCYGSGIGAGPRPDARIRSKSGVRGTFQGGPQYVL